MAGQLHQFEKNLERLSSGDASPVVSILVSYLRAVAQPILVNAGFSWAVPLLSTVNLREIDVKIIPKLALFYFGVELTIRKIPFIPGFLRIWLRGIRLLMRILLVYTIWKNAILLGEEARGLAEGKVRSVLVKIGFVSDASQCEKNTEKSAEE